MSYPQVDNIFLWYNEIDNMTELIIQIDILYFLGIIASLIGIAWFAGIKIGKIENSIEWIKNEIEKIWNIVREKPITVSNSPMVLNETGQKILNESGIKNIILENKEMLLNAIREKNPETAYDVQEIAKKVVNLLKENTDIFIRLKNGAFKSGTNIDSVLLVGSFPLRDMALKELGFKTEDLDNNQ